LLDPRADEFPAPPAAAMEMATGKENRKGKGKSVGYVSVPKRASSKYASLIAPSSTGSAGGETMGLGLRQVSMTWHKEVAESGSAKYSARWSGLNFEEVRSLRMSKGMGSGLFELEAEVPVTRELTPVMQEGASLGSKKESNGRRDVSMSSLWKEGKLRASYCEVGESVGARREVSMSGLWKEGKLRASYCEE